MVLLLVLAAGVAEARRNQKPMAVKATDQCKCEQVYAFEENFFLTKGAPMQILGDRVKVDKVHPRYWCWSKKPVEREDGVKVHVKGPDDGYKNDGCVVVVPSQ